VSWRATPWHSLMLPPASGRGKPRCARYLLALTVVLLASACATPQTRALLQTPAAVAMPAVRLDQVPFYPQDDFQCGPAALATVLHYSGLPLPPAELTPSVYIPAKQGSLPDELLAASRRHGRLGWVIAPTLDGLLHELNHQRPVLVMQNLGLDWLPRWHFAVVYGYDLSRREVYLRSGTTREQVLPLHTFEHTWARSGHWGMVVHNPEQPPRGMTRRVYLQAALDLERTGPLPAAYAAWRGGASQWPDALPALLGAGNTAFTLQDYPAATHWFRQAVALQPDSIAAHNNLALSYLQLAQYAKARQHVETAQGLSQGRILPDLEDTARTLAQREAQPAALAP
jgi:hypothetical protein